ncbi:cytochrome c biogenesis heme-transporting ATPase CcmA [Polynucleobacter sp. MWH-Svant-W18]|uniref:cytochrome c biogenesis heme-transporting ATPase CcmA n=1 Tax=Polynucleobacter sp. MWH-Svant-W18 TaxID=1855909 RepID=UPI001BFDF0C0|nr:cytochrome c biogenesis heme-transporting ATPase CcmA [Polynucleobacter sp. MWH-Svant-W18]QWD77604.1 cytochrome c biogenesis heme-transporting ATPase CcmA [Polynucleobacter sp. MWH-Svant-W18]
MTATISPTSSKTTLALEARGLSCVRGERQLFSGLDLSVSAGQCLHVRGENGVGKTSLLRILTGLSKPESGEVLWGNQSIGLDSLAYHRELLFLGHRDALKEDLSAIENLKMYAELDDVALPLEKALTTLWRFGLRGRENLPVHCLSAGQKRRLLMARMLTRQAKLWILDEPFNALDSKAVNALQDLIAEHLSDGGLVVLTSHQTVSLPSVRVLEL